MKKKNAGVTTIVVVCVIAIIMALSLSLFLTASVLMRSSANTVAAEQCRILAVTLSRQLETQLTDPENVFEDRLSENAARAEDVHSISLWHYVREEITDGAWPYYEEDGSSLHNSENAIRTFSMDPSGVASEIASYDISMYWTCGKNEKIPKDLVIKTGVTVKGQSCTITDCYRLRVSNENGYESWKWEHVDKQ